MRRLPVSFYRRPVITVARELLGKLLIRKTNQGLTCGRIVETEAYGGSDDPASHAFSGPGARSAVMFEDGGKAYVYFIYGMYYCLNVVTGRSGTGEACLIRAIEPVDGIDLMKKRRQTDDPRRLTNGPGKLCIAMDIDLSLNGYNYSGKDLFISDDGYQLEKISCSARIGIRKAQNFLWRFYIEGNPFVTGHLK